MIKFLILFLLINISARAEDGFFGELIKFVDENDSSILDENGSLEEEQVLDKISPPKSI